MERRFVIDDVNPRSIRNTVQERKYNEEFVFDERDRLRPADFIQRKLQNVTPAERLSVSCLHTDRIVHRPAVRGPERVPSYKLLVDS
jgi:hypothetical protein